MNCFATGFAFGRGISFLMVPDPPNEEILVDFAIKLGLPKAQSTLLDSVIKNREGDLVQRLLSLQECSIIIQDILDESCLDWFLFGKTIHEVLFADHLQPILQTKTELIRKMEYFTNKMVTNENQILGIELQNYVKAIKNNAPMEVLIDYLDRIPPMMMKFLGHEE